MANLSAWLLSLAAPLASRVMLALGIGVVTYTGVTALMSGIQSAVITAIAGMPAAAAQIAAILGLHEAVGITLGAIATRVALTQLTRFAKV